MDANHLQELSIGIPCPDCGDSIERTFEWLQDNNKHWCPSCHVEIDLDGRETRRSVGEIKRALEQVQRAVLEFQLSIKK